MADARAEQIMAAVDTLLAALTTTGSNVQRDQVYPHEEGALPAIAIQQGADVPVGDLQTAVIDWELTFTVIAVARVAATYTTMDSGVVTTLNQIRKEVHAALFADYTLGLGFVIDILPGAVSVPTLDGDGELPHGSLAMEFTVRYRSSRTDISA